MTVQTVKTQKEAHGGHCATCEMIFDISSCPFWHWSKSVAMHRSSTGHKVELFQVVAK